MVTLHLVYKFSFELIDRANKLVKNQSTAKIRGRLNLYLSNIRKNEFTANFHGKVDLPLNAILCKNGV